MRWRNVKSGKNDYDVTVEANDRTSAMLKAFHLTGWPYTSGVNGKGEEVVQEADYAPEQ